MIHSIKNIQETKAKWIIGIFSVLVLILVSLLGKIKAEINLPFDPHIFARINALLNGVIATILVFALVAVKQRKFKIHEQLMLAALCGSILFLISYVAHHLFSGETHFGGQGSIRFFYFFLLITHIILAAFSLPFILFSAFLALKGNLVSHKKLVKFVWPVWFYVAVTGPIIYLMISPYYE